MLLSDFVIDFIARKGVKHVFMVSGGGGMYLIDSLGRRKDVEYICNHHEQASAMAAEGYQRITGNIGAALVTTGPAGTNAITGLMCAWNDSIPLLMLSGQANSRRLIGDTGLRQKGVHEADITKIVESVTKYAVTVKDPAEIRYHMEKAFYLAKAGRPGPVWVDIPLDVQSANINPAKLKKFVPEDEGFNEIKFTAEQVGRVAKLLVAAKRPMVLAGHGIILSGAVKEFLQFVEKYQIPVVTSKNAFDIIPDSDNMLAGRIGINGQRAGNFAVQNSDLILTIGCRLAYPTIGYETELFGRGAKKIIIDIDKVQMLHGNIKADMKVRADAKRFISALNALAPKNGLVKQRAQWLGKCRYWRKLFPVITGDIPPAKKYVNSYYFFDALSGHMKKGDVLVTDQGATFYSYTVAFKNKRGQHAFTNGGFSPMGYGLPAAIGACFAHGRKPVVCVHGEGGLEMNIQELQTIKHYKLPIKLFVFNNNGYLSIKHTQNAYFNGRLVGCDPSSGVSCVDISRQAAAYDLPYYKAENHSSLDEVFKKSLALKGPAVIEVIMDPLQPFLPKVASARKSNGQMVSKPLEDMYPFLPREQFYSEMIVKPVPESL